MGNLPEGKLMSTHLQLMAALASYHQMSRDDRDRERLMELILVQSSGVLRHRRKGCGRSSEGDWPPGPGEERVSLGYELENAWQLAELCHGVGMPPCPSAQFG